LRHAGSEGPVTALAEQYVPPRYRANPGQH
jgi:hypothetical protein